MRVSCCATIFEVLIQIAFITIGLTFVILAHIQVKDLNGNISYMLGNWDKDVINNIVVIPNSASTCPSNTEHLMKYTFPGVNSYCLRSISTGRGRSTCV
jgi:hypothetical protein